MESECKKRFYFGISGTKLTEEEIDFFRKSPPEAIVLFARNINDTAQLMQLTAEIKKKIPDVKIAIDFEGGRVNRLKNITISPDHKGERIAELLGYEFKSQEYFGNLYKIDKEAAITALTIDIEKKSELLKILGIDINFAPVCDINYNIDNDAYRMVMGNRCFSDDQEVVTALAISAMETYMKNGITPCIKHIPGHGRANADSHKELPIVDTKIETLEKTDFKVFKDIVVHFNKKGCGNSLIAMTAHIVYNCLDEDAPVTMSKKALDYIRQFCEFKGKFLTDAFEMKALDNCTSDSCPCCVIMDCSGNLDRMQQIVFGMVCNQNLAQTGINQNEKAV